MSQSPMTPSRRGLARPPTSPFAHSSAEKKSQLNKQSLASYLEPSPASTYGETVASSVPATPQEVIGHGTVGLGRSARVHRIDTTSKNIQMSPFIATDRRRLSTISSTRSGTSAEASFFSPQKLQMSPENVAGSSKSSPVVATTSRCPAPAWPDALEDKEVKPTDFDDPFVSVSKKSPMVANSNAITLGQNPQKMGMTPTGNTAQAIFPPQACVFVANLSQSESDEQLEHAVTEAFQQFGNVYVKIRRDARQMPFAFAQYTNVVDAQRAITLGRGMIVSGRPCRTEVARVNRSLYLSKINGGSITETEAREIMDGNGNIETLWYATQTERELFGLPDGVFIRFAFFDDCRDVVTKFRDSNLYRLEQVKGLEDSRNTPMRSNGSPFSPFKKGPYEPVASPTKQGIDRFSVFVGNLPPHLTEHQLSTMFQGYGRVINIEMIRKPSISSRVNTFAFIEFDHPHSATVAVQAGSRMFKGLHLRIEHKDVAHAGQRTPFAYKGLQRRNHMVDSPEFLAAFQRGISVGMSQVAQSIMPSPYFGPYPSFPTFENMPATTDFLASSQKDGAPPQGSTTSLGVNSGPIAHYGYNIAPIPFEHVPAYVQADPSISQGQWSLPVFDDPGVNSTTTP